MSEAQKTTLLSMAMAQLDLASEAKNEGQAKEAIANAKKMIADVYDRQMAEDDK